MRVALSLFSCRWYSRHGQVPELLQLSLVTAQRGEQPNAVCEQRFPAEGAVSMSVFSLKGEDPKTIF